MPTSPVPEQICGSSFLLLSSLRASMHSYCPSERLVICRHASGNGRWPSPEIGKGFLSWFSLRIVHCDALLEGFAWGCSFLFVATPVRLNFCRIRERPNDHEIVVHHVMAFLRPTPRRRIVGLQGEWLRARTKQAFRRGLLPIGYLNSGNKQNKPQNSAKFSPENL